ncbi:DUF421 domain-containing protein [Georgenia thermotolerans]|uniref:DUF421 domain-containing protein n=1 Tax=Georgenia thermotolerans TaxID=527326 RepID=A0A7J5UJZ4_9MICO|nr:YetF domain-containing protein [Georgenia thermotolerans]KAE8762708.1 DUF421 domain-containing protein [Georgenia thermotolerans]
MGWLTGVDRKDVFVPNAPLLEIFIRGTVVYLALYTLLRVVLKRQRGGVGVTDLLVIVLIADAAQNAMAGQYTSLPDGVLLVAVIISWSAFLDWLGFRFPAFQRFVRPGPLPLVRDGLMIRKNMAKEYLTEDELMSRLHIDGLTSVDQVEEMYIEGDGQVSIIRREGGEPHHRRRRAF